jgi:hypothetical protein
MRADTEDISAFNTTVKSGKFSSSTKILAGPAAITLNGSIVNFFDPNGATRLISMPPVEKGRFYVINNTGVSGSLDVRTAGGTAITVLGPNESALMFADAASWTPLHAGASAIGVFTDILDGLVPAPHTGGTGTKFLRDDGAWGPAGTTVTPDGYKFMTDGVNTATGVGADTFRFRSSTGSIGLTITNNQVTFGDNIDLDVLEAAVDHNALLNYSADRHVAHSGVVLTAGLGISGGGDISASRTFDFAPSELTVATPSTADYVVWDLNAGGPRRTLVSTLNGVLNHNALNGYVPNQHIDHSGVSIVASTGLQGGGDITASRSLALSIGSLPSQTPIALDEFAFRSNSDGGHHKVPMANLNGVLDHNALFNYVANQHFADAAADGLQYARKNNAWTEVTQQSYGSLQNYFFNAGTVPPPAVGSVRFNNPTQNLATLVYLHYTTNDTNAVNLKNYFTQRIKVGDTFYFQDKDDITKWQLFVLNAAFTDNGTYATLPVTWNAGGNPLTAAKIIVSREAASVASPIGEAPANGVLYARKNTAWAAIPNITVASTAPSSPAVNDVWIDTT